MEELANQTVQISSSYPIWLNGNKLEGELILPENATRLIIFSHGSGSSRFSKRNKYVAEQLNDEKIGTYLFDLLSVQEDAIMANRFNINLLTERLTEVVKILKQKEEFVDLEFGLFGASTGAAAALKTAACLPNIIKAFVSRGGRVDLAIDAARAIKIPSLFIVGELDYDVLFMNQLVYKEMNCIKRLEIVPEATHLFEEKGALEEVSFLACNWFKKHL